MEKVTTYVVELTNTISEALEELNKLEPGTKEYLTQAIAVKGLLDQQVKREASIRETDSEIRKNNQLVEIEKERLKVEKRTRIIDTGSKVLCTVLSTAATIFMMGSIMKFEENGTIGTKAYGWLPSLAKGPSK